MQTILASLKDIPGVVGSFVLSPSGALLAKEMPKVYPDAIFPDLGRRLVSVGEVLDGQTGSFQELLLKFEGSWVFIRRTTRCLLSVLVSDTVNHPALRMATNVALKRVTEEIEANPAIIANASVTISEPEPEPVAAPAPAPAPAAVAAPAAQPEPAKRRRMWRGQFVD
jgi:predicted regulator of Ras-like GTPase activity (Roadblock/LC7/MglB family)